MTPDPASLSNLRDLALPAPVSWWPPQPGWWILLCTAILFAGWGISRWRHAYLKQAYRRQALAELAALQARPPANLAATLMALLKRTALAAYPRAEIAGLTGTAWLSFLNNTGGRFSESTGQQLWRASLDAKHNLSAPEASTAIAAARAWVRQHRAPPQK